ncbi:hypothetical protein BABINDRAFT_160859 [Babjeviella inositovora NRRL Y-12698]|uniref:YMC020W-like alpha/beta hydrolase domain-containing protein n=1 Tax=Babjeviella inositovora NRRL Y-12698 TaxID=984486 RepID=A0A1E3QSC3_9ASCO|nr:uncharacterized protein BABINDRAFT_160859 [Babjeviella inositovora NRRL Y-12698]ODQ80603.1 hypothetical protein BABINDRAFT_160859 [Babjeviella inositovora NRRL Y-12698]
MFKRSPMNAPAATFETTTDETPEITEVASAPILPEVASAISSEHVGNSETLVLKEEPTLKSQSWWLPWRNTPAIANAKEIVTEADVTDTQAATQGLVNTAEVMEITEVIDVTGLTEAMNGSATMASEAGTLLPTFHSTPALEPPKSTQPSETSKFQPWGWSDPVAVVKTAASFMYTTQLLPSKATSVNENQELAKASSLRARSPSPKPPGDKKAKSVSPSRGLGQPIVFSPGDVAGETDVNIHIGTVPTQPSWFSWLTRETQLLDSAVDPSSEETLRKDATQAIHGFAGDGRANRGGDYAVKNTRSNSSYGELAVLGTGTQANPVSMSTPIPITANEVQEMKLQDSPSSASPALMEKSVVIPQFDQNYRKITYKTRARLAYEKYRNLPQKHLYRVQTPPELKSAVVIGIHGFFPIKMVRSLIGQPTGTSVRFATEGTRALQVWAKQQGIVMDIQSIALEGEGRILERAENLHKLLDNWIQLIRSCDFLFFCSHSQGVPVAIHILARLLEAGDLESVAKIGMINMAGICMGPFAGMDAKIVVRVYSTLENDILHDFFDLQDAKSEQSQKLLGSLEVLLRHNVKVTFTGSVNDQLIPLYSSLALQASHPNIFRSVYIDAASRTPLFMKTLLNAVLLARNAGGSDHLLLQEISKSLMGTLTGGGHSRVYHEQEVYLTGIRNCLETTDLVGPVEMHIHVIKPKALSQNPYHLPWCMRGFVDEFKKIRNVNAYGVLEELIAGFREWEPTVKQFKDMKYCMDVIGEMDVEEI